MDPGGGPLAEFADDLRRLRTQAGNMPYRALAKRAGYSASTLSVAASGTMLPSLEVTLAYVQVCGGDTEAWRARWHQVAGQLSRLVNDLPPAEAGEAAGLSVDRTRLGATTAGPGTRRRRRTWWFVPTTITAALLLILAAAVYWLANSSPAPTSPTPTAGMGNSAVPVDAASCGALSLSQVSTANASGPAPSTGLPTTLAGDVQHLVGAFSPGSPAGGPLVLSGSYPFGVLYDPVAVDSIVNTLTDVTGAAYDDPTLSSNGGMAFMFVTVGTPKPGQCWALLAYDALVRVGGGGDVANVGIMTAGPHLAAAHVVLECGQMVEVPNICAWAGPGPAGGKPVFGVVDVVPVLKVTPRLTYAVMTAFTDRVYAALTAS